MPNRNSDKTKSSTYAASFVLVEWIDGHLKKGTRHFRRCSDSQLLRTLPEVCFALETLNLTVVNA